MVHFLEEKISDLESRQKRADHDADAIQTGNKSSIGNLNSDDDDNEENEKSAARSRKDRRKKKKDGKKARSVTKSSTRDGSSQRGLENGDDSENGHGIQLSQEDLERVQDLQEQSSKLKSHVRNLKVLIRQLDNGSLEADNLMDLKDELEGFMVRLEEAHEMTDSVEAAVQ